jgi:predicted ester cyclase
LPTLPQPIHLWARRARLLVRTSLSFSRPPTKAQWHLQRLPMPRLPERNRRGACSVSKERAVQVTIPDGSTLWDLWIELWNGDLAGAEEIIDPDFVLHRVPSPQLPAELGGRARLVVWVTQTRALFADLRFSVAVGPIVDGDLVAGRWIAEGVYQGGIPGSTAPSGTPVRFRGNDIWRAENGLIREYWLSDDLLDLMQQLGVISGS